MGGTRAVVTKVRFSFKKISSSVRCREHPSGRASSEPAGALVQVREEKKDLGWDGDGEGGCM